MSKLILFSMIIAAIAIPARAARASSTQKGLKNTVVHTLIFNAFYAFALVFLWGRC